jgi:hypothetical protein
MTNEKCIEMQKGDSKKPPLYNLSLGVKGSENVAKLKLPEASRLNITKVEIA